MQESPNRFQHPSHLTLYILLFLYCCWAAQVLVLVIILHRLFCIYNLQFFLFSSVIQYNTIQYNTIQYNTIKYNTMQYNTVQYSTIHFIKSNQLVIHRLVTLFLYLNNLPLGQGCTEFPALNLRITPERGTVGFPICAMT